MFIQGYRYISKAKGIEFGYLAIMTNSDEMFIRRVSFMNGINGSHSHRIDFKNVDEGNMGTFLSRVLGYDYQYEKITEKQFFSYQKKLIDSIQKYQILIGADSWRTPTE